MKPRYHRLMLQAAELEKGWRELLIRRALLLIALAGGALAALLLRSTEMSVLVELALGAIVAALIWLQLFRCPVCGDRFFRYSDGVNPFARKCAKCGATQSRTVE
jgi:hypothetical protein